MIPQHKMIAVVLGLTSSYLAAAQSITMGTNTLMGGVHTHIHHGHTDYQIQVCSKYMQNSGCYWTIDYNCPGQPAGSKGSATNDGSLGYECCCTYHFWWHAHQTGFGTTPAWTTGVPLPTTPYYHHRRRTGPVYTTRPVYTTTPAPYTPVYTTQGPYTTPCPYAPGFAGGKSILYENIPRYIKLKYKLIQWFENQKMCPFNLYARGFPAWVGWKAVMAAAPAITTPSKEVAGLRVAEVKGFCPALSSQSFSCVKEHHEVKARFNGVGVTVEIDQLVCTLKDISLYKLASGFVGVRLDFADCKGTTSLGVSRQPHMPKTLSMNMKLGNQPLGAPQSGFSDFFKSVCASGAASPFKTFYLPKFNNVHPKFGFHQSCFAASANTAHVIGKGCYDDFIYMDLQDKSGNMAVIPAADFAALEAMIPGVTALIRPKPWQPSYVPAPAPSPNPPPVYNSPCETVPPPGGGRRLDSPCATVGPPAPEPSPCATTTPAPTTVPLPPETCASVVCPVGTRKLDNAGGIPCTNPHQCTEIDVYKCCAHESPDVPGVIIQDRLCLLWKECGCDNNCCLESCKTTTPPPPIPPVYICLVYPWEKFLIAIFSAYISVKICIMIWGDWERGTGIAWYCTYPGDIVERVVGGKEAAKDTLASKISFIDPSGMAGGPEVVVQEQCTTVNLCQAYFLNFFCFGFVTLISVHLVWVIKKGIQAIVNGICGGWTSGYLGWDGIDLWYCPFALIGIWLTQWWIIWLVLGWLLIIKVRWSRKRFARKGVAIVQADAGASFLGTFGFR